MEKSPYSNWLSPKKQWKLFTFALTNQPPTCYRKKSLGVSCLGVNHAELNGSNLVISEEHSCSS